MLLSRASMHLLLICLALTQIACSARLPKASKLRSRAIFRPNSRSQQEEVEQLETKTANNVIVAANSGNKKKATLNAFDLCICGAFATALGDVTMHPIDTIKIMQQTGKAGMTMIQACQKIMRTSGPSGFYQGVIPYMTADGLSGAIKFATFEISKVFTEARIPVKYHGAAQFVCAAGAMLACSVLLVPGEVLKTRLQAGVVKNIGEAISTTLKQDGIAGLFAGYYATLVRDVPYTMLELGLYENIKSMFKKMKGLDELEQKDELIAAAITGAVTGFLTTPLDLIKTKLMMQSATGSPGIVSAFKAVYREGGTAALFTGATARVAWLLPFTTIYLGIYEGLKKGILAIKQAKLDAEV